MVSIIDYVKYSYERHELLESEGRRTSNQLRDQVDQLLTQIVDEGQNLATLFGSNDYTAEEIEELIKKSSESISGLQGVTACYEPYAFSSDQKLYCPYYNKGTQDYLEVGESYDYTIKGSGTAWYTGVRDDGAKWVEPYYAKAAKDWYLDYGVPFYYQSGPNKGKVRGTITMSFIASGFKSIVQSLSLGKTGFGIITSQEGTLLSHPVNEFVGTKKLDSLIDDQVNPQLASAYKALLYGQSGTVEYYDKQSKDKSLFYYDQIPTSKWGMGVMFFENDILSDEQLINRKYIVMSLLISLFLVMLLAIYFNKDFLDEREIWQLSWIASFFLLFNVVLVGFLQHRTTRAEGTEKSPPIVDVSSLKTFISQQHERADVLKLPHPIEVPTGLFIQRLEFQDSYNLNLGGTVWQKYPSDTPEEVQQGFTFPQMSPFAESAYIEESYRKEVKPKEGGQGYTLIGWDFRVTLRLNLQYADFPFDKRKLNIELTPLGKDDYLLFTPDLESYTFTNPTKKSGLSESIEMSGNRILESYFNYSTDTYESDFGYGDKSLFEEVPTLHFNIHLKRILLNAFVTYLIPIVVCLIMIFILLLSCTKTVERQGVIESMAAFFFVLVFSHIDLRKEIVTADLIYMEYFYFITYLMVIITTMNLVTYTKDKSKIFDYNNNQLFKAVYFPMFFGVLLLVTLLKFF